MKKFLTLFVALSLCMGLAVPALAAEFSYTDSWNDVVFSVDAVSTQTTTLNLLGADQALYGEPAVPVEVTLVTVAPNTPVSVKNSDGQSGYLGFYVYDWLEEEGYYHIAEGLGPLIFDGGTLETVEGGGYELFQLDDTTFLTVGDASSGTTTPVTPSEPAPTPDAPTPDAPVVPDAPGTYTVKKGDTMGQIAVNYYGSYGYHNALYKANAAAFKETNGKLLPGMKLTLPEKLGKAVLIAAPTAAEGETLYTVKAGDTLGKIAADYYGQSIKYKEIFERNADRLKNANTIYEGQVIVLPAK